MPGSAPSCLSTSLLCFFVPYILDAALVELRSLNARQNALKEASSNQTLRAYRHQHHPFCSIARRTTSYSLCGFVDRRTLLGQACELCRFVVHQTVPFVRWPSSVADQRRAPRNTNLSIFLSATRTSSPRSPLYQSIMDDTTGLTSGGGGGKRVMLVRLVSSTFSPVNRMNALPPKKKWCKSG